jgi:hypothetical protein
MHHPHNILIAGKRGESNISFVQHNLNDIGIRVFAACSIDDTVSKYPIQHLEAIACLFAFLNIFYPEQIFTIAKYCKKPD